MQSICISSEFLEAHSIRKYFIDKRYESKKNNVYLIKAYTYGSQEVHYVLKYYPVIHNMHKELEFLELLMDKVAVPEVLFHGNRYLILEHLDGILLLDALFSHEGDSPLTCFIKTDILLNEFVRWLRGFYSTAKTSSGCQIILGDVNFRNFIFNEKIFGIDFEDCRAGYIEEDAGRICAFSLSYLPAFTEGKIEVTRKLLSMLIEALELDRGLAIKEIEKELYSISKRRKLSIPPGIIDRVLA